MNLPEQDEGNSEIERMWAQKRVGRLLGAERSGKGSSRDEIIRLCEGYSIVSPYASMLVLENDAEYKRWKIEQRNAVRIKRDRESRVAVQEKLAEMRRRAGEGFELDRAKKLVSTQSPSTPATQAQNQPSRQASRPASQPARPSRGVDLNVGSRRGGGGGGAIDPVTGLLALGTAGAAAWANRRRKRT